MLFQKAKLKYLLFLSRIISIAHGLSLIFLGAISFLLKVIQLRTFSFGIPFQLYLVFKQLANIFTREHLLRSFQPSNLFLHSKFTV